MRRILPIWRAGILMLPLLMVAACGAKSGEQSGFPKNFGALNDAAKMDYMIQNAAPDSVARFICQASLGRIEGVKIDTLNLAALRAYEYYKDDELQSFQAAFDDYVQSLPLPDKMRLYKLAASDNPSQLGYKLGLEYANDIREGRMTAAQVEAEIEAMRKACSEEKEDSMVFKNFMTGFQVVLDNYGSDGIPPEIYSKYK
ncbi:MAG: hypothetical protein K2L35_08340 [Muribaculaceae bacterium]|nr:hypothetical protein [Muribaculaceae bacterium]MDE6448313.1 hypothetical protein [Muribaculaceae bacterium]MDE7342413.1 hypothetical protein [Muribaculaceae bacterium]